MKHRPATFEANAPPNLKLMNNSERGKYYRRRRQLYGADLERRVAELREEQAEQQTAADEQLAAAAKSEGNAFFRQGQMQDAVAAYSRSAMQLYSIQSAINASTQFHLVAPFMRRAAAYIELREFGCAVDDLVAALEFEPRNKECHAKLQSIVDAAVDKKQRMEASGDAELRYAGVRAAVIASVREGWSMIAGAMAASTSFGGRAVREQKPAVFVLDENDDSSWDIVPTLGTDAPSSRAWHTTSAIGNRGSEFYCVYGGVSSRGEDSYVHLLVPASPRGFQWLLPRCLQHPGAIPAPRSGHAAVSIEEENGDRVVYMFGGRTKQGVSDQLLTLRCISRASIGGDTDTSIVWDEVHLSETDDSTNKHLAWPSARDGHSMCWLDSRGKQPQRLVVFGGNGQLNDERMNDTWLFDVEKQRWTLLQCSGDIPPPRSYHTAHTIGEFLFVIGGRTAQSEDDSVYMLDVSTSKWSKVPIPTDRTLNPRGWHSSVLTEAGRLFVLGGGTYHGPLKDAATLDLSYIKNNAASLTI
ncbi:hypothetical protein ON010_g8898 [Phytophthora cinnamomi]|nr:hypothetical protein ON010_g8898 [Phytophthora cinnamomi]